MMVNTHTGKRVWCPISKSCNGVYVCPVCSYHVGHECTCPPDFWDKIHQHMRKYKDIDSKLKEISDVSSRQDKGYGHSKE